MTTPAQSSRDSRRPAAALSVCLLLAFSGVATSASGQQPASPPNTGQSNREPVASVQDNLAAEFADPTNAALVYSRAWLSLSDDLLRRAGNSGERTFDWRPDEKTTQDLAMHQVQIEALIRATSIERADWGIEYSQGIQAMLPHLGKMRQSARLLGADARRLLDLGQNAPATSRVVAMLSMPRHCSHDGVLISSLVGGAIATLGAEEAEVLLASNKLDDRDRQRLIDAIDRLLSDADPFGVAKALRGERHLFLRWLQTQSLGKGSQSGQVIAELMKPLVNVGEHRAALDQVGRLNEVGLKSEFNKAEKFYDQIETAWATPATRGQVIADLERRIDEFGPITKMITPSLSRLDPSVQKALDALRAVRAKLAEAQAAESKVTPV